MCAKQQQSAEARLRGPRQRTYFFHVVSVGFGVSGPQARSMHAPLVHPREGKREKGARMKKKTNKQTEIAMPRDEVCM